ncbi:ribonuclease HII [Campylobacter sp. MIT 12-8780]|uniref:ribonuclease HII n=1 Tax=Campylobacter sp. MIT 12-8780 TaxID=2202200 RepID=UPI00115F5109|nr:ribonuclease HII [Campylobacter sp. MIT 12-8780]TQR40371.1 ribonuclease HII [Campylobacter sp. MIT 12-8780]
MNHKKLIGIDEAGRGALAGPLFMAACLLNKNIAGLKDSKALSATQRKKLFTLIKENSSFLILAFSNKQIDEKGLSYCLQTGLKIILRHFSSMQNTEFLFDGNTNFKVQGIKTLIKADTLVPEVSAASILAKVSRDEVMIHLDSKYKNYGFKQHKGYASKAHIEALRVCKESEIHRSSFKLKCFESSLFD